MFETSRQLVESPWGKRVKLLWLGFLALGAGLEVESAARIAHGKPGPKGLRVEISTPAVTDISRKPSHQWQKVSAELSFVKFSAINADLDNEEDSLDVTHIVPYLSRIGKHDFRNERQTDKSRGAITAHSARGPPA